MNRLFFKNKYINSKGDYFSESERGLFMEPKKIEILAPDIDGLIEPDEIQVQIDQKQKYTPDIIRDIGNFLLSVADFYDQKRKGE